MSDPTHDPFEEYLAGDSTLSRLYAQTRDAAPPPALDRAILHAARKGARRPWHRWRPSPWAVALATVAVVSLGLVQLMPRQSMLPDAVRLPMTGQTDALEEAPALPPGRSAAGEAALPAAAQAPAPVASPVAPAAMEPATSQRFAAPAEPEPAAEPDPAPAKAIPPRTWLARIAALRRQGRLAEAYTSLRAFRQRYPDYALPQNLVQFAADAPESSAAEPRAQP